MKRLRIFILLLLAVLLPIRGALAAAMLCPDGAATTASVNAAHDHHNMQPDASLQADHASMHHHAAADAPNDASTTGEHPPTCHFCASGCCMATILGAIPVVADPGLSATVEFPSATTRVPSYLSGAQDRPPRTT